MADMLFWARPIDSAQGISHHYGIQLVELVAKEEGWVLYDPMAAFTISPGTDPDNKIAHINRVALAKASALVAYLPETRTAGVFMEIAWAERMGIPIAWFGDDCWDGHWSLALRGIQRVADVEEAVAYCIGAASINRRREPMHTTIHVEQLHENAKLPSRAYSDDAGFDLYCSEDRTIASDHFCDVPLGIAIQPPPGLSFRIVGRSSTFRQRRLLVMEGIIDSGFRGELFAAVLNMAEDEAEIKAGERVCQMIPITNYEYLATEWATELAPHPRGRQGFGSTGK